MSFLHKAFIENTPEAREWLESIGYEPMLKHASILMTLSKDGLYHAVNEYYPSFRIAINNENIIDCRGSLPLFKAITALRDDSDYMQWYIENKWIEIGIGGQMVGSELRRKIGEQWYLYLNNDSKMTERIKMDIECSHNGKSDFRKATLEELIEHFKTEKV